MDGRQSVVFSGVKQATAAVFHLSRWTLAAVTMSSLTTLVWVVAVVLYAKFVLYTADD
jgi:hypothetical protein